MKSSAIRKQNNQVMPAGSRLWTPANIGNDLKLWMRPEGIRPFNGESLSSSDVAQNKWLDSSSFRSVMGQPDNAGFVSIAGLKADLVSAGNGITFGTQNAKKFDFYSCANTSRGGSITDASAPQIDAGTGEFTVLTVCRLKRSSDASIPYLGGSLTIMSDGTSAIASEYELRIDVVSNGSSDPSTLKVRSEMTGSNIHEETIESKAGNSQLFDNEEFLISYERDASGNSEFYSNGTSLGTSTVQGQDLSDGKARNFYCRVLTEISGQNVFSSNAGNHVIAEVILIHKEDATTRILCEGYLAHKYGRQDKLASTHKYRYGPPRV
jgi:hypothetical protein